MKSSIDAMKIAADTVEPGSADAAAEDRSPHLSLGPYEGRRLGDYFGLMQFGVSVEILPPGSKSLLRHWHAKSDELLYVLEGELTLITNDGEAALTPGHATGFKAGGGDAHHLENRSNEPAKFLVVGTRVEGDAVHYPDDDFQWLADDEEGSWYPARRDGTKY
ncbi:MAG: cupin domain-containing protein [Proteobacteria bacterium]|jgi:uncharacterized cupin superfamily protein|nr:cupin domain-containing protein [Pseudomonadota bacterium]